MVKPDDDNRIEHLLTLIEEIPMGRLATYGLLGEAAGMNPRHVARVLANDPEVATVPWHRVVGSDGKVRPGTHRTKQIERLKQEGVTFKEDRIRNFKELIFIPDWLSE